VRLEDHVVAGYFLACPSERLAVARSPRRPAAPSACSCLGHFAPDTWCIEWASERPEPRVERAAALGVDASRLPWVTRWVTERFAAEEAFFPNLLARLEDGPTLRALLASSREDLGLYGLALPGADVERFLGVTRPPPSAPGFAPNGEPGLATGLRRGLAPDAAGRPLGYEPLVQDGFASGGCSWLCTGEDEAVEAALGIRAGEHGLLVEAGEAIAVCRWLDEHGDHQCTPGTWFPWLLIRYDAGVEGPRS
jgi:hypothetical protein